MGNLVKIVIVGDAEAGKTSLLGELFGQQSQQIKYPRKYEPTKGVDFVVTKIPGSDDSNTTELQVWDSAGNPNFQSLGDAYQRFSDIFLYCLPISSNESVRNRAKQEIETLKTTHQKATILLIGTKSDEATIDQNRSDLSTLAGDLQLEEPSFTSAQSNKSIEELKTRLFAMAAVKAQEKLISMSSSSPYHYPPSQNNLPYSPKPSRRLRYLAITSLVLAPIALGVFLTVSLSAPAALPALATVLPFLLLVSPLAAGFIAGGLVAAVFLLIAATTELVFRRQQNHMELLSGDNGIRRSSSFGDLLPPVSPDDPRVPAKPRHESDPFSSTKPGSKPATANENSNTPSS